MAHAFTDLSNPLPSHRRAAAPPPPPAPAPPPPAPVPDLELADAVERHFRRVVGAIGAGFGMVVLWTVVVALVGTAIAAGVLVGINAVADISEDGAIASPARPIALSPLATRSVVYAKDGSVLAELHAEEDRVPIPLDKVPAHVVRAVLDAEDERFFEHGALDARALLRAVVNNLEAGGVTEGGSTITQQLVKIELLTSARDVNRKLKEAFLALEMERQYTKEQILERYLNAVYLGNGAYGLEAAAQRYFGTDAAQLTLPQAVLLAGLIRYPGGSDPFSNPDEAKARRDLVADRMLFLGHITAEEADWVKAEPLPTPPPEPEAKGSDYFAEHVKQELLAAEWLGETAQERYQAVFKGGLHVSTTLDPNAQQVAQDVIERIVPEDPRGFTAALASVEPGTGAVRALVGGKNFDQTKFNLVTDGDGRQVGSSFKLFTLMAALEAGILPIDSISGAAPCPIANPLAVDPIWSPTNVEGQGGGTMTLASATISSVNCAYARLIKHVGPEKVVDVARRMGITNPLGPHLSITLGSEPVTPLQMATGYATVAADGMRRDPFFIERVDGKDGTMLWKHADAPVRAISSQNARIATSVLTQVVSNGTGTAAAIPGRQVGGKTGSADENADAWFVGYTPQLATAVWMGAPQGRVSMYNVGIFPRVYGGTYPAMIFGAYMRAVLADQPVLGFPEPAPYTRGSNYVDVPNPPPDLVAASRDAQRDAARAAAPTRRLP
ncbi:MAG: transglycosylase domain-containing protein [Acidimicrobiales bacterium]